VRVTLTRQQMFTFGYRPRTLQRLQLGAAANGRLLAVAHTAIGQTSRFEDFTEHVVEWSGMLYHCDNVQLTYKLLPLDVFTPLDMRAPGAALGLIGLECAMDELACALAIDPVQLRLINYAERNQNEDKPYSSKQLRACYAQGAQRFGWEQRNPEPRSMRQGRQLVGWGMAGGVWEAMQQKASARASLDSSLPKAPLQGGSFTVSSVGTAVQQACEALKEKLLAVARQTSADFAGVTAQQAVFAEGHLSFGQARIALGDLVKRSGEELIDVQVDAEPDPKRKAYATATHSAVFVEVLVDEALGTVKVNRVVSAIAAGRGVNPKMARSQILGGVVWGIGMALHEETQTDHGLGRHMNHNLAEYHIPVNADIGDIDVLFVEEHDEIVNALGSKGVANAIYHATGKRVRDFPITLDKLL